MTDTGQKGIFFESQGHRLLGTLFLAKDDTPKPTVILLHGMPGIEKNFDLAFALRAKGWNSLIFHYQGCWGSEGDFTFRSIPEDVNCAINELSNRKQHPEVDCENIILFGHSLGGWASVLTGAKDSRVRGIVAVAPITMPNKFRITVQDAAAEFCPWLTGLSPESFIEQWESLDEDYYPIQCVSQISPRPLLILHGACDNLVTTSHSEALYEHASKPKEYYVHPDANHSFVWHRGWLQDKFFTWLKMLPDVPSKKNIKKISGENSL